MSLWSKLFGGGGSGGGAAAQAPVEHGGFSIHPGPINEGGRWRIGARIEKEIDGVVQSHQMIRADTLESAEAATEASIAKARMLIDQQGAAIFG